MSYFGEGPYPIYGSEDENWHDAPMPGDNPPPPLDTCPKCDGNGGWYLDADGFWSISRTDENSIEEWIECDVCQGMGAV